MQEHPRLEWFPTPPPPIQSFIQKRMQKFKSFKALNESQKRVVTQSKPLSGIPNPPFLSHIVEYKCWKKTAQSLVPDSKKKKKKPK